MNRKRLFSMGLGILLTMISSWAAAQEIVDGWDLPTEVSQKLDLTKYGQLYEGSFWPMVGFQQLTNNLEESLLKSDARTNFLLKNPSNDVLELSDFNYMVGDTVGYFVIWGDSMKSGSNMTFLKPNLYVRELFIYGVTDCDLNLVGRFGKVNIINCENISVSKRMIDAKYSMEKLIVNDALSFINCSFSHNFNLNVTQGGGKVQFETCTWNVDQFKLAIPDSMQLVFDNTPFEGIRRFVPGWKNLSEWLIPQGFLFWEIRQIDSLGDRFCKGYDHCLSADGNKLAWTENYKIVLHQFQEYYQAHYEFDKGDSVFRSLKVLETETYLHDLQNPRSETQFKSTIHYYFMSFMGWFCGFGTEPIMALYNAVLLILVFALIYILFPTRFNDRVPLAEDGFFFLGLRMYAGEETEIDRLLSGYRAYVQQNPQGTLWKFYYHRRRRLLAKYRRQLPKGLSFYIQAGASTNRIGQVLISLYLKAAMLPYLSHLLLISIVEQRTRIHLDGLQKRGQKANLFTLLKGKYLLAVIAGLFVVLLARIPVGLLVSVNAFSTLGFGQLPLRGVTKYVAILEGLVGWFTLTLFSITYVNILLR
jgi:hypothetical protein